MDYSLGIDLGTTYSAAATARGDRLDIFQLGERAATIPSVIVLRADGEVLVGEAAERRAMSEPLRTAREFKRRLGDPTPIILGGTPYGAEALIGHLLRSIVAKVSEQLGGPPAAIAVCHPASYGEYKIDLLRQAVRQSDIGLVEFITEPQAAALHYALQERVPTGEVIAVYDFGGGTFDATILRKTEDGFDQLGRPEGMERLGGIDFDEAIFAHVMATVRAAGVTLDPNDPATLAGVARLREECRRAKEGLSTDTDATIAVYLPGIQTDVRLTREEFESMIRPRIRETIAALERAARSAGLGFDGIDRILLVGGSSRIPLVAEMVRESTHRPIALDAHPKHTMALGAAWVAQRSRQPEAAGAAGTALAPGAGLAVAGAGLAGAGAASAPDVDVVTAPDGAVGAAAAGALASASSGATDPAAVSIGSQAAAVPITAGAVGPGPAVAPPAGAGGSPAATGRPSWLVPAAVAGIALVVVAAGAFAFLPRGSGGGAVPSSSAVGAGGPSLPIASALGSPSGSASASIGPSVSPSIAASPTPTPAPTPTPTPAGKQARINSIDVSGGRYVVDYEVFGYTQKLPGMHVHFFFDTVPPTKAGMPAKGPWYVYAGPIPFKGYKVSDRPAKATQMCILVANPDHSVIQKTGNCVDLPN
ncbi:MAG TPA: Hsp70 family protein [Patescibacteria group bacterium]|nr:Hsp70 family protein [Patescibacteria group bacterium]